jgi:flagella basal body P-ring formation protein FlgA
MAMGAAAAAAHGGEDAFPAFQASVAALVATQVPGADGARVQFSNPGVASGAAQMYGAAATLSLHAFDVRACRFAVKVENAAAQLPPALITGTCAPVARIPVAARDLKPGDMMTGDAIKMTEEALARIPANAIRDAAQLVGRTPRQALQAGRPIQETAVKTKPVVEKGQPVTLRFVAAGLELTAQGLAQADAAPGELVPVLNLRSKKIVDAVARGHGLADISAPNFDRVAAAN